jgi:hypothetical protein
VGPEDGVERDVNGIAADCEFRGWMLAIKQKAMNISGSLMLQKKWSHSLKGSIAHSEILLRIHVVFNRERREAEARFLSNCVEDICCSWITAARLRHEEWIPVAMISLAPFNEI